MAHLWLHGGDDWRVLELAGHVYDLTVSPPRQLALEIPEARLAPTAALLLRAGGAQDEAWLLVAGREARVAVAGDPVLGGARRLADRDSIRFAGAEELFFSTERLAVVEPHPVGERALYCPRCKQAIAAGTAAVRCPSCRVWHHQNEELPCWTYASTCALCPQPSALDAGFRWTPEDP
jgi:hypothetical protein